MESGEILFNAKMEETKARLQVRSSREDNCYRGGGG